MTNTYSIKQAAEQTNLTAHTLRYYERIELIGPIGRDAYGRRFYTQSDIGWIQLLMRLKLTGMSLDTMKQYAELQKGSDPTGKLRRELLEQHERDTLARLSELNACLDVIRYKIQNYKYLEENQTNAFPGDTP